MVSLPLLESFLRKIFHTGLSGSTGFVQHLVLAVGMFGGALAAREGRLLSLSAATNYLKGKWKSAALVFSNSFAAAIAFQLFIASVSFVLIKMEVRCHGGQQYSSLAGLARNALWIRSHDSENYSARRDILERSPSYPRRSLSSCFDSRVCPTLDRKGLWFRL